MNSQLVKRTLTKGRGNKHKTAYVRAHRLHFTHQGDGDFRLAERGGAATLCSLGRSTRLLSGLLCYYICTTASVVAEIGYSCCCPVN